MSVLRRLPRLRAIALGTATAVAGAALMGTSGWW
jgi:ABC-type transport system involved in cytochrome bd biosynthesis fused ATPase/permease subunit